MMTKRNDDDDDDDDDDDNDDDHSGRAIRTALTNSQFTQKTANRKSNFSIQAVLIQPRTVEPRTEPEKKTAEPRQ